MKGAFGYCSICLAKNPRFPPVSSSSPMDTCSSCVARIADPIESPPATMGASATAAKAQGNLLHRPATAAT